MKAIKNIWGLLFLSACKLGFLIAIGINGLLISTVLPFFILHFAIRYIWLTHIVDEINTEINIRKNVGNQRTWLLKLLIIIYL